MTEELKEPGTERERAFERIKKRRDFQTHLVAFFVINAATWTIWGVTGAGYPWPAWLTGAWAIGVFFNAWDIYVRRPITDSEVEREIKRLRPKHSD